jgi:aryl-alcohol dehydrogenase-like predicted oxidoreductase
MTTLGLGTVQLGIPYGNNAQGGLMSINEAHNILQFAIDSGMSFFDTAQAYGESEARIGSFKLTAKAPTLEISTKLPRVEKDIWCDKDRYLNFVRNACQMSRRLLGVEELGLLQFHQCDEDFLSSPSVRSAMTDMLDAKICKAIGISVYEPSQAEVALDIEAVSALQIPASIIDTRFFEAELLAIFSKRKTRILTRSVFMQGVLLAGVNLPPVRKKAELEHLRGLFLESLNGTSAIKACLRYILTEMRDVVDTAIIGVDSIASLKDNILAAKEAKATPSFVDEKKLRQARIFATENKLLNPALWNFPG